MNPCLVGLNLRRGLRDTSTGTHPYYRYGHRIGSAQRPVDLHYRPRRKNSRPIPKTVRRCQRPSKKHDLRRAIRVSSVFPAPPSSTLILALVLRPSDVSFLCLWTWLAVIQRCSLRLSPRTISRGYGGTRPHPPCFCVTAFARAYRSAIAWPQSLLRYGSAGLATPCK
jgi:hypothetical protein